MPLEKYSAKRRFESTPEPPPSGKSGAPGKSFCVQRHDATRLHYDFRLEIDGVLKSWAVPKGPTLDPAARQGPTLARAARLCAAQEKDPPIEYGSLEGNIPGGNYGAGSVMLWARG